MAARVSTVTRKHNASRVHSKLHSARGDSSCPARMSTADAGITIPEINRSANATFTRKALPANRLDFFFRYENHQFDSKKDKYYVM